MKRQWYGVISEARYFADPSMLPQSFGAMGRTAMWSRGGSGRHDHLFDATLLRGKENLANRMMSEMMPAGRTWAQLEKGTLMLGGDQGERRQAKAALTLQDRIFRAIHASPFYLAGHMMVREAIVAGTGLMKVGKRTGASGLLDVQAVPQDSVALEAGVNDQIWGFFRKLDLDLKRMKAMWPEGHDWPIERAAPGNAPTEWEVLEATTFEPSDGLWHYQVLVEDGSGGRGRTGLLGYREVWHRTYAVCPWLAYRYSLRPGEVQGRGPVFEALPAARTANKAVQTRLESASIRAVGMWTYRADSVFNPRVARLRSGAFLQVGSNNTQDPTIRALELPGEPQMSEIVLADERRSINETCLEDDMPDPAGPVRSPTEWLKREQRRLRNLGTPYLRLAEEVARPFLRIVAYLLHEARELPEIEAFLPSTEQGHPAPLKLDGTDMNVSFTGPMVQAQRLEDATNIVQFADAVIRTYGPQALMTGTIPEEAVAELAEKFAVPPKMVRDPQARAALGEQALEGMIAANTPAAGPEGMAA